MGFHSRGGNPDKEHSNPHLQAKAVKFGQVLGYWFIRTRAQNPTQSNFSLLWSFSSTSRTFLFEVVV